MDFLIFLSMSHKKLSKGRLFDMSELYHTFLLDFNQCFFFCQFLRFICGGNGLILHLNPCVPRPRRIILNLLE